MEVNLRFESEMPVPRSKFPGLLVRRNAGAFLDPAMLSGSATPRQASSPQINFRLAGWSAVEKFNGQQ